MRLLLKDKGITVNLKTLKPRNGSVEKLFTNITSTLDLMSIKYTVPRPNNIRVFTAAELEAMNHPVISRTDWADLISYYGLTVQRPEKLFGRRAGGVILDDLIS